MWKSISFYFPNLSNISKREYRYEILDEYRGLFPSAFNKYIRMELDNEASMNLIIYLLPFQKLLFAISEGITINQLWIARTISFYFVELLKRI